MGVSAGFLQGFLDSMTTMRQQNIQRQRNEMIDEQNKELLKIQKEDFAIRKSAAEREALLSLQQIESFDRRESRADRVADSQVAQGQSLIESRATERALAGRGQDLAETREGRIAADADEGLRLQEKGLVESVKAREADREVREKEVGLEERRTAATEKSTDASVKATEARTSLAGEQLGIEKENLKIRQEARDDARKESQAALEKFQRDAASEERAFTLEEKRFAANERARRVDAQMQAAELQMRALPMLQRADETEQLLGPGSASGLRAAANAALSQVAELMQSVGAQPLGPSAPPPLRGAQDPAQISQPAITTLNAQGSPRNVTPGGPQALGVPSNLGVVTRDQARQFLGMDVPEDGVIRVDTPTEAAALEDRIAFAEKALSEQAQRPLSLGVTVRSELDELNETSALESARADLAIADRSDLVNRRHLVNRAFASQDAPVAIAVNEDGTAVRMGFTLEGENREEQIASLHSKLSGTGFKDFADGIMAAVKGPDGMIRNKAFGRAFRDGIGPELALDLDKKVNDGHLDKGEETGQYVINVMGNKEDGTVRPSTVDNVIVGNMLEEVRHQLGNEADSFDLKVLMPTDAQKIDQFAERMTEVMGRFGPNLSALDAVDVPGRSMAPRKTPAEAFGLVQRIQRELTGIDVGVGGKQAVGRNRMLDETASRKLAGFLNDSGMDLITIGRTREPGGPLGQAMMNLVNRMHPSVREPFLRSQRKR